MPARGPVVPPPLGLLGPVLGILWAAWLGALLLRDPAAEPARRPRPEGVRTARAGLP